MTRSRKTLAAALGAMIIAGVLAFVVPSAFAATLYSDNFEDGNADGWSKSGGEWSVVTDGSRAYRQAKVDSELARAFAGNAGWTDYSLSARVKPLAFDGSGRFVGISARTSGSTTFYRLALLNSNRAELQAVRSGTVTVLGGVSRTVATATWYTLRIDVSGTSIRGFVDGVQVASATSSMEDAGRISLQTFHATATFDDVVVSTAPGTDPTTPGPGPTTPGPGPTTPGPNPTTPAPVPPGTVGGWATVNGSTTGGAGGGTVVVTTASALASAVAQSGPLTIRVSGTISMSGMTRVSSNKTILGNAGATITGGGLMMSGVSNIIIRNISFRDWADDAINVETSSHHIWIDHNSFTNGYDGAVDIKRGSDYITVSWNRVYAHGKSMLLGHSDDNAGQDVGHLRVTYHHNYFDGSGTRHPRVRFGNPVHVYNNYYRDNEYGVASTMDAGVLVEGNYFENVDEPTLVGYAGSDPGTLVQRNNVFVNSGAPQSAGSVASIPYPYSLESANTVKSSVTAGAGAGRISV